MRIRNINMNVHEYTSFRKYQKLKIIRSILSFAYTLVLNAIFLNLILVSFFGQIGSVVSGSKIVKLSKNSQFLTKFWIPRKNDLSSGKPV